MFELHFGHVPVEGEDEPVRKKPRTNSAPFRTLLRKMDIVPLKSHRHPLNFTEDCMKVVALWLGNVLRCFLEGRRACGKNITKILSCDTHDSKLDVNDDWRDHERKWVQAPEEIRVEQFENMFKCTKDQWLQQLGRGARGVGADAQKHARVCHALVHGRRGKSRACERQHARGVVGAALKDKALELAGGIQRVVGQQRQPRVLRAGDAIARCVKLLFRRRAVCEVQHERALRVRRRMPRLCTGWRCGGSGRAHASALFFSRRPLAAKLAELP